MGASPLTERRLNDRRKAGPVPSRRFQKAPGLDRENRAGSAEDWVGMQNVCVFSFGIPSSFDAFNKLLSPNLVIFTCVDTPLHRTLSRFVSTRFGPASFKNTRT